LVFLFGVVAYSQTLLHPFVWDDFPFIVDNQSIQNVQPVERFFLAKETLSARGDYNDKIYRPLRTLSFALIYQLNGADSFFFHLLCIFVHAFCGVLVFLLGMRLGLGEAAAFLAAAVFAFHPVHSEAVSWISSLADPLAALFFLAGTLILISSRGVLCWAGSLLLFVVGLFSKEMAITWPAVMLVWWWSEKRKRGFSEGRSKTISRIVIVSFLVGVAYFFWRQAMVGRIAQEALTLDAVATNLGQLPLTFWTYFKMFVWPFPLNAFRPPFSAAMWSWSGFFAPLLFLLVYLTVAFRSFQKNSLLGFFLLWFLISLAPVSNLLPLWIDVAERFLYLPSIALALACGFVVSETVRRIRGQGVVWSLAVVIVLLLAVATVQRNTVWSDDLLLAQDNVDKAPHHPAAYWNLGNTALRGGEWARAARALEKCIELDRPLPRVLVNLGAAYIGSKQWEKAARVSKQALEINPNEGVAWLNLGAAKVGSRDFMVALNHLERAETLLPRDYRIFLNRGIAYFEQGNLDKALTEFNLAREMAPRANAPLIWLVRLFNVRQEYGRQKEVWQELVFRNPEFKGQLGEILQKSP